MAIPNRADWVKGDFKSHEHKIQHLVCFENVAKQEIEHLDGLTHFTMTAAA